MRVASSLGAHYLEYTYAPTDRILNGEIQALVGLYDYTSITKDPVGLALFEAGDAEERVRTPLYDTGAWSMYDQFGESDLNYHELLTEFLTHLCERTRKGEPLTVAAPAPTPTPAPATTPTTTTPGGSTSGGTTETGGGTTGGASAARYAARSSATSTTSAIPGDAIYCTTAEHFTAYEHTPPVLSLITTTLPTSSRAGRAAVAVEGRDRAPDRPARRQDRVQQQCHRRTGQAEAAVAHPFTGRLLRDHAVGDRPGRQLRDRFGDDHRRQGREGALRTSFTAKPSTGIV